MYFPMGKLHRAWVDEWVGVWHGAWVHVCMCVVGVMNDVYSVFLLSLPWCTIGLGVYFKQLGLQVFRPTSQSMVLQSTLQPSALFSSF